MGVIIGILAINTILAIDGALRANERRELQQYRMQKLAEMSTPAITAPKTTTHTNSLRPYRAGALLIGASAV